MRKDGNGNGLKGSGVGERGQKTQLKLWNTKRRLLTTYQYSGKLCLSSSHQRSSSNSFSRSRGFLPSFGALWGVIFLLDVDGRDECFLYEGSVAETAFRTSVMEVLPEA